MLFNVKFLLKIDQILEKRPNICYKLTKKAKLTLRNEIKFSFEPWIFNGIKVTFVIKSNKKL